MSFLRKLRKNKFVALAVCVIVVSFIYTGVQNAIANYAFNKNADIVSEEENFDERDEDMSCGDRTGKSNSKDYYENGGQFEEGEMDLELEGDLDDEGTNATGDDGIGSVDNVGSREENSGKIYIYITGEVNAPGVVILSEGCRIVDAINAAGGTTAKANVTKVNLVYVLEDGMKVNIPNDNDLKNNPDFEYITLNSGDGSREDYSGGFSSNGSNLSTSSESRNEKKYSIVNINTATQTELETLPGIGPSLALKIINYRKENGKFSYIDEIKNVNGIGESKFEDLKRYITV